MTIRCRSPPNASPSRRSLSPCVYMSAVSKKVMPSSTERRNKRRTSCREEPSNTPPIRAQPKPISETVSSVLPKRRYRICLLTLGRRALMLQVLRQAGGGPTRKRHRGERGVFLDGGREAAG